MNERLNQPIDQSAWVCVNRQTKEKLILNETEAFELDTRLWMLKKWHATMGGAHPPTPCPDSEVIQRNVISFTPKCTSCGAYHAGPDTDDPKKPNKCKRLQHIRFDEIGGN